MMRALLVLLIAGLAACGTDAPVNRADVAEFVIYRGADPAGDDKTYRIKLNGRVTGDLRAGESLRTDVAPGRFTMTAETEPKRIPLGLGLGFAPLERTTGKPFNMRPGRQVVVELETGPFGGPRLIERRGVDLRP